MMTLDQKLAQAAEDAHMMVDELGLPPPKKPRTNLVMAVAAAVVVLVVGGLGWWLSTGNNDSTPVITQPPTTVTTTVVPGPVNPPWRIQALPSNAEWGTLDTPVGPAHWVHLTGDVDVVPGHVWGMEALAWPSGFAIFQPPFYTYPGNREEHHPARLLASPDGIEWHVEPLPTDPAAVEVSLTLDGGVYWLTSNDPAGLWRSTDGATWHEYDPSPLESPGHDPSPVESPGPSWGFVGVQWLDGARLASVGELTVLHATFTDEHGDSNIAIVERLYIVGESLIERVDVPWPTFASVQGGFNRVTLFGVADFVYAYIVNEQSDRSGRVVGGDISVWRTTDGRSWTDLGPLSFPDRPPSHAVRFASAGDTLTITFFDTSSFGIESDTGWETTDGVNWTPLPSGRPEGTHPVPVESGWFSTVGDQGGPVGGQAWWMNARDTWVSLEDLSANQFCDGSTIMAVDNTTFISGRGCAADFWILHLDRSN